MATVQSNGRPRSRIAAGNAVLAAAGSLNVEPVKKRLSAFSKAHTTYIAKEEEVERATGALAAQQKRVAEADVDLDEAVMVCAAVLPADGLPRLNPFKPFGAPAPSDLCVMGYGAEVEAVLSLEKAILKRDGLSKPTLDAAKRMGDAARKAKAAQAPLPDLEASRASAVHARNALDLGWETAFASLKRASRAAEDEGAMGLYTALFDRAPARRRKAPPAAPVAPKAPEKPTP